MLKLTTLVRVCVELRRKGMIGRARETLLVADAPSGLARTVLCRRERERVACSVRSV